MLTIPWIGLLLYGGLGAFGCYALGVATAYWWQARHWPEVWALRSPRDLEEARWRDGAPYDGQLRGVRWLPLNGKEERN